MDRTDPAVTALENFQLMKKAIVDTEGLKSYFAIYLFIYVFSFIY